MSRFMIYGANGYTGQLIAKEAASRGLKPLLAGRNREALSALAASLGLHRRVFGLSGQRIIEGSLEGVDLVLNCAGPFAQTCAPLLAACLECGVHYLDITGEIDVFAHCHEQRHRAADAGIAVVPGVGFDVVPTDCVAMMLKQRLPNADELVLAFEAGGGPSPGTAKTSLEGLARGGRVRLHGNLVEVPLAWKTRHFERDGQRRTAVTIPWGDVFTAHISTGIPSIETYMAMSPSSARKLRLMRWLKPLLASQAVQDFMRHRIERSTRGPGEARRRDTRSHVWGEVRSVDGSEARLQLSAPNGYELTTQAALAIASRVLDKRPAGGYYTPGQLMGADFVLSLPQVKLIEEADTSDAA